MSRWCRAAPARGEDGALVTATVSAPPRAAAAVESTRSGDPPDWLTASQRTPSILGSAPYTVRLDGDASPAGRPRTVSMRYLAYRAAWSLVPRAARRT